jgi:hypothetical protein
MTHANLKWALGAALFFSAVARAGSSTHVCAEKLALFVSNQARAYTRAVILNNSLTIPMQVGLDPEMFSRLFSVDDIFQDIQLKLLRGRGFDPNFHNDQETLVLNNHLKRWITVAVHHRISTLVRHTNRADFRKLRELPQRRTDSGGWVEIDIEDRKLPNSVLDLLAERPEIGDKVASDYSNVEPGIGVSPEQWNFLLASGPRWVAAACQEQQTSPGLFWAHQGGLFTATDFAEELLEQTLRWLEAKRGSLDHEGSLNSIAEMAAQKMVEELTGTLEVQERALSWMRKSGSKARNAAVNYVLFYLQGVSVKELIEKEKIDKAAISYRKKTAQRTYFEFAHRLLQYPPKLFFQSLQLELEEDAYLQVIEGIEAELGETATAEKRRFALTQVRNALIPYVAGEGKLKGPKTRLSALLKSAVAKALEPL